MKSNIKTQRINAPSEIKQHEEVRKYRLESLEETQHIIINKLDNLSEQLQKELYRHDTEFIKQNERIKALEKRTDKTDKLYDKIKILMITELFTIVGVAILYYLGLH